MMQLHPGDGVAEGVLHQLDRASELTDLRTLWRREMTVKPPGNIPRWIETVVEGNVVPAIAFTANPESRNYIGGLSIDETAAMIATACGHWGSCAEYLLQTVTARSKLMGSTIPISVSSRIRWLSPPPPSPRLARRERSLGGARGPHSGGERARRVKTRSEAPYVKGRPTSTSVSPRGGKS